MLFGTKQKRRNRMLKNNWIKLILTMGIALFSLIVIVMFHKNSKKQNRSKQKVEKRLVIPSEFLGGKNLSLGDDFEMVEKVEELRPYEDGVGFFGEKNYSSRRYRGIDFKYFLEAVFNVNDELLSSEIKVYNKKNVPNSEFFVKTVEILTKYYGEDYEIFGKLYDNTVYIQLEWKLSKHTRVRYSCALLDSNLRFREYAIINSVVRYDSPYTIRDTVGKSIVMDLLRGNKTVKKSP